MLYTGVRLGFLLETNMSGLLNIMLSLNGKIKGWRMEVEFVRVLKKNLKWLVCNVVCV